ncbi:MAG: flagellar motor switch protein FliG [Gemmatimonadetes bacterium]|jgi:flagellar motor switch protein FliG|nr:flagellar motor switch protein FliG [Gemmatimonadota bacterium]MBK7784039.1 flagellar motor switch protein FliG [Gemmatimonadota bacterium]MBK7924969.1 flagellar motor switch protein FliG [Gemmatimonadota bacterium]MBK9693064.1 flagellar motor switch protein FliG [Gemmatimonadota bacterium]MBP6669110.1 flagellar motor switch protein FliG [Gemmatimonadales bacterium]
MATAAEREPLSGAQKAAVLCMSLGTEVASKVMQLLAPEQVEVVSREIAAMPLADTRTVEGVLMEYRQVARAVQSLSEGGLGRAQEILEQSFGPAKARSILERIKEQLTDSGLKKLKKAAPEVLLSVLRGEHPQTLALILAHLETKQAATVIEVMDTDLASDVLYRVARMEKVAPDMVAVVEQGLSSKTDLTLSQEMTLSGGPAAVAKVLTLASGSVEKAIIESITQRNHDLAQQITNLMFAFEDLITLDGKSMQRILRDVDSKELALALKAASEELRQHIMKNMSERAAQALQEEMEFLGPVRVKDVEAAQQRIIAAVRTLEEAGEIVLGGRGGDDELIV